MKLIRICCFEKSHYFSLTVCVLCLVALGGLHQRVRGGSCAVLRSAQNSYLLSYHFKAFKIVLDNLFGYYVTYRGTVNTGKMSGVNHPAGIHRRFRASPLVGGWSDTAAQISLDCIIYNSFFPAQKAQAHWDLMLFDSTGFCARMEPGNGESYCNSRKFQSVW